MASKEEFETEAAMHRSQAAINANSWVVTLGLKPIRDGNQWCFLWGENLQEGVAGFGDTPHKAMLAFEDAMYSKGEQRWQVNGRARS